MLAYVKCLESSVAFSKSFINVSCVPAGSEHPAHGVCKQQWICRGWAVCSVSSDGIFICLSLVGTVY